MSSRVAKWVFVLVAGVVLSALSSGAAPQPGPSHQIVLEHQFAPISGLTDTEALILNAAGTKGYIVHVGLNDNAFITEFTVPNTKGGTCELGVPTGPRGSHAVGYDEANARLWVGNFPGSNVLAVDVSQPIKDKEKCIVTGTVTINDAATDVIYDGGRKQAYVSGLMTNSVYVLVRKEGEKEEYKLEATIDLSESCQGPNAMALGAYALFVVCRFTHNVVRVDLATSKVGGVVSAGELPADIKIASDGKLYIAATGSNALAVIDSARMEPPVLIKLIGLQTSELNPHYVALSPDQRLVYTSNTTDQSVSAICRELLGFAGVFRAIPAPWITSPGVLAAVSFQGQQLLYVADKGGFLRVFDMSSVSQMCP